MRGWKKSKPKERLGVMRAHGGETFRRGSTQWAHSKAGQGVGQRTGGSVAGGKVRCEVRERGRLFGWAYGMG